MDDFATHFHTDDELTIVESVQDVEPYLERNKAEFNSKEKHTPWNTPGPGEKVASIPLVIAEQWWKELGDDPFAKRNRQWLARKLNDPDNRFLRTRPGVV